MSFVCRERGDAIRFCQACCETRAMTERPGRTMRQAASGYSSSMPQFSPREIAGSATAVTR
jgi:hypothetical protein